MSDIALNTIGFATVLILSIIGLIAVILCVVNVLCESNSARKDS